jgi:hypothetical protein
VVVAGQASPPKEKSSKHSQMMGSIFKISMEPKRRPLLNLSSKSKTILTEMPSMENQNNLSFKHSQPTLKTDSATQITYVATPNLRSLSSPSHSTSNSSTLLTISQATIRTKATLARLRRIIILTIITQATTNNTNSITRMIRIHTMIKIKATISSTTTKTILIKTIKINNMISLKTTTINSLLLKHNLFKLKKNGHMLILLRVAQKRKL